MRAPATTFKKSGSDHLGHELPEFARHPLMVSRDTTDAPAPTLSGSETHRTPSNSTMSPVVTVRATASCLPSGDYAKLAICLPSANVVS